MHETTQNRFRPVATFSLVLATMLIIASSSSEADPRGSIPRTLTGRSTPVSAIFSEDDGPNTPAHDVLLTERSLLRHQAMHAHALRAERAGHAAFEQAASPPGAATAPAAAGSSANWAAIAQCESSGDWSANTGNGYWGGLQFAPSTWFAYGGGPFDGVGPFPYSSAAQIAVAARVLAAQGSSAWPNCFVA